MGKEGGIFTYSAAPSVDLPYPPTHRARDPPCKWLSPHSLQFWARSQGGSVGKSADKPCRAGLGLCLSFQISSFVKHETNPVAGEGQQGEAGMTF